MAKKKVQQNQEVLIEQVQVEEPEQVQGEETEQVQDEEKSSKNSWSNKDYVLKQVAKDGFNLKYADPKLKADKEVVAIAVKESYYALTYANPKLKADKKFILSLLDNCMGYLLNEVDPKLKEDNDIIMKALKRDAKAIFYAPREYQENREIALDLVKQDGTALMDLHKFKDDKEIVMLAVENDYTDLAYKSASERLRQDEEVIALKGKKLERVLNAHRFIPIKHPSEKNKAFNPYTNLQGEEANGDKVVEVDTKVVEEVKVVEAPSKKRKAKSA